MAIVHERYVNLVISVAFKSLMSNKDHHQPAFHSNCLTNPYFIPDLPTDPGILAFFPVNH
eukprot:292473-Amorphochlora_amoeboformis.AAC.1